MSEPPLVVEARAPLARMGERVARQPLCPPVVSHEPRDRRARQQPQIAGCVFVHAVCALGVAGGRTARDSSVLLVHVEQTALAGEPDVPVAVLDDLGDPPDEPPVAVVPVMSERSTPGIELVEAAVLGTEPEIAVTVLDHALDRSASERVTVLRVMQVTGTALGPGIESIHPGAGGNPQISFVVLHQILEEVGAQAARVVRVVLVHDEAVTVIAIEAVSSGKPHEAPAVLQDIHDVALRQTMVGREMRELEVCLPATTALGVDAPSGGPGRAGRSGHRGRTVSGAQEQDAARAPQAAARIRADGDHATIQGLSRPESTPGWLGVSRRNRRRRIRGRHEGQRSDEPTTSSRPSLVRIESATTTGRPA